VFLFRTNLDTVFRDVLPPMTYQGFSQDFEFGVFFILDKLRHSF